MVTIESTIFKKYVNIVSYNVAIYIIGERFNGMHDVEKMADLSQTVFMWSTNEAFKRTNTHTYIHTHTRTHAHTDTPTNAIGKDAIA